MNHNQFAVLTNLTPYLIFALIVLSAKLIIIAHYGNSTPFWDQWDAEAENLYLPLIEGNLTWANMFAAHNEHRIFTTRVLALVLFYLSNGIWNPLLQMQVNAIIHVLALAILLWYITKALTHTAKNALLIFCTIIFSIPFGWENTLAGFQSQFYFLLLFSFIFLWAMTTYKIYSISWWLGTIAGMLSFLSLASGVTTLISGIIILALRFYINKEPDQVPISAIIILIMLTILAIVFTPEVPRFAKLKAQSIIQFLSAFSKVYSWPNKSTTIVILTMQTPILLFMYRMLYKKEYQPTFLFLATITFWLFGQFAIIAYGRAEMFNNTRYSDLFAIGLIINFAAMAILYNQAHSKVKWIVSILWILWINIILLGFINSKDDLIYAITNKLSISIEEETNVRNYIRTKDFSHLQGQHIHQHIPYSDSKRLKKLLDNPTVLSFLPSNIYSPNLSNY